MFSKLAGTPAQVHQLLTSTGSRIDAAGQAQFLTLVRMPSHISTTLAMMSQWNLEALMRCLPQLTTPCLLITASGDRAVPPTTSGRAAAVLPNAQRVDVPGFGHLVHEEAADKIAPLIRDFLAAHAWIKAP